MRLIIASIPLIVTSCSINSNPESMTNYDRISIQKAGVYEFRAFIDSSPCAALGNSGQESTAELLSLINPVVNKGIDFIVSEAMKKIAEYGNELTSPVTKKVNIYPTSNTILESQCIIIAYGEYGGNGRNNLNTNAVPFIYYSTPELNSQLSSNLGFAMQISISNINDHVVFTPVNLFYPVAFHSWSSEKYHSLDVNLTFEKTNLTFNYGNIKKGSYFEQKALIGQSKSIKTSDISINKIDITITEGPDNETLGRLLISISNKENTDKITKALQDLASKKDTVE